MKKRKVLIEKNSEHKEASARPSAASIRSAITNHQKRPRSIKSPSEKNLHNSSNSSDKVTRFIDHRMVLPDEMPPKTRFDSRNKLKKERSTTSPRLKSFPAEEIKKLNNPPMFTPEPIVALIAQQDPRETGTFYTNSFARNNNGHGDAISIQSPYQQSKPENACSTSQQQVVANHQEIRQMNPYSESMLTRRIASPERQAHRPFVPNSLQGAVVYDRPLRSPSAIINQPIISQTLSTPHGSPRNSHAVVDQSRDESSTPDTQHQMELISDRDASDHRHMQMQRATIAQNANVSLNDQTASNRPNVNHPEFHAPFQQNPHQVNQQTQHSVYGQQMLPQAVNQTQPIYHLQHPYISNKLGVQCSHYNQRLPIAQGQGMTSPQDMTVSQMRLMQHSLPIHQQNLGYPVSLQPARPQNVKWMRMTNQNQQSPTQWQYYYQAHDTDISQQNPEDQAQFDPSRNLASHKPTGQSTMEAHGHREGKKTLQFTSDMIRDQELLVSAMRQQDVPEEVMRRQFDALLNEQKRHLTYIAQFQQRKSEEESKKIRLARRRRTEKDEKPEWMIHITPPRISYRDIERINAQQSAMNERHQMDDKSAEKLADRQKNYHRLKKEEMCNQVSPQQMYTQVKPCQQAANWPYRSDCQTSFDCHTACYGHQQNAPYITCPPILKYAQYPHNIRYNPYYPHSEPQVWSKEHNPSSMNPIDNQGTSIPQDLAYFYQQKKRPIENSSLLKMRIYKEIICPQKRNNGLQDPENIQKMLEALKDPTSRKGLEYLANLTKKKPLVRLNGIQNSNEIPEDMQPRPPAETLSQSQKRISANGLENNRNPNNPPSRVLRSKKRADETLIPAAEYPRQRQNARNCYSVQAEKENNVALRNQNELSYIQNANGSVPYDRQNVSTAQGCHGNNNNNNNNNMVFYGEGAPLWYYHQMHNRGQGDVVCTQQSDAPGATRIDRAGGDTGEKPNTEEAAKRMSGVQAMQETNAYGQPEIRETRTIGGITYLARKPERAPNNLAVSPDKLIAGEHTQVPKIF